MEILFPIFYRVQRVLFDIFGVFRYSELTFCDEEQKLNNAKRQKFLTAQQ